MIDSKFIKDKLEEKGISKAQISRDLKFKSVKTLDARLEKSDWKFDEVWLLSQLLDCDIEDFINEVF